MHRLHFGVEKPQTKATLMHNISLALCITAAKVFIKTMHSPRFGAERLRTKAIQGQKPSSTCFIPRAYWLEGREAWRIRMNSCSAESRATLRLSVSETRSSLVARGRKDAANLKLRISKSLRAYWARCGPRCRKMSIHNKAASWIYAETPLFMAAERGDAESQNDIGDLALRMRIS